jgi:hypothetical protein
MPENTENKNHNTICVRHHSIYKYPYTWNIENKSFYNFHSLNTNIEYIIIILSLSHGAL